MLTSALIRQKYLKIKIPHGVLLYNYDAFQKYTIINYQKKTKK